MVDATQAPFVAGFLARLSPEGVLACSCGRAHRIGVADVLVEPGALDRAAELLIRRHGANPSVWVLSDENTEAAAGHRWKEAVADATRRAEMAGPDAPTAGREASLGPARAPGARLHAAVHSRVLPARPRPVPSAELAAELAAEVKRLAPDLVVAVGGGVMSDLVKRVSLEVGLPSWCIATSPSVDAYSSATASLRVGGFHQAIPARTHDVIVCDLDVLAAAPRELVLAGLGDLLAKFVAHLDWNLSAIVTGEHYCAVIAELALGSARMAARAAGQLGSDPIAAVGSLTDAILMSGFAMQAIGSSRPAASAEHTIAHLWETAHAASNQRWDLHGVLVGAATRLVLAGYQAFYRCLPEFDPDPEERRAALAAEPGWRERLEDGMQPFAQKIAGEMRLPSGGDRSLDERLDSLRRERERIAALAGQLLAELAAAIDLFDQLGFPFSLDAIGIDGPLRMLPVRNVRLLRARYTTFDLAREIGRVDELEQAVAASL
jgi:glycerol-1-phosphate dehydrogenase [NAD(P)+]